MMKRSVWLWALSYFWERVSGADAEENDSKVYVQLLCKFMKKKKVEKCCNLL